jgi:hypothetical protein
LILLIVLSILCSSKQPFNWSPSVKNTQKLVLCLGLATLLSAPLAGCGSTWNGVKNDWHDMTGSSESSSDNTAAAEAAPAPAVQPAPAAAAAPAAEQPAATVHSETTTTTTTYNR